MNYREPGREIDVTEIERAKIHASEETKREAISERETTRREQIQARKEWWSKNGGGALLFLCVLVVSTALASVLITQEYLEHKYGPSGCVDRATTFSGHCTHPAHEYLPPVPGEASGRCRCRSTNGTSSSKP